MNHSSIDPELDTYNQLKKKWRRVRLEMKREIPKIEIGMEQESEMKYDLESKLHKRPKKEKDRSQLQ